MESVIGNLTLLSNGNNIVESWIDTNPDNSGQHAYNKYQAEVKLIQESSATSDKVSLSYQMSKASGW